MLLFVMVFFLAFAFMPGQPGAPLALFGIMALFFGIFYIAFAMPSVIAGYGLLKKKSWARIWSIIAAVVSAMNVPIGTAAAVYALWFFFGDQWKEVYEAGSYPNDNSRKQIAYGYESQRAAYEEEERQPQFRTFDPPDWR
jgi:hypothetical protein